MRHYENKRTLLKPYRFPKGFMLVVDTREQAPLFTDPGSIPLCVNTLHNGDYSIKGFEDKFGVERKQMSDLYSYIGKERDRTVKKLERLSNLDFAGLIIEANIDDLKLPYSFSSRVTPEMVRQFLVSVNVRYGIHIFCDRERENLEMWLLDRAIKFFRIQREV